MVEAAPESHGPNVSYAAAVQKSVHNWYERLEPLLDQLVYHRVRSIEPLYPEVPAFLRLRIEPNGGNSTVTAESSGDGQIWITMGTTDFGGTLPLRGLVVSSHDGVPLKALFADVRRNGAPLPFSALTKKIAIGTGATGDAFEGVSP